MPAQTLPFYDAVLAVTDTAINKSLAEIFASSDDFADMDIEVDPAHGVKVTATFGAPTLTFLENDKAKLTLPIVTGTYYGAAQYNVQTKQLDPAPTTKLDGDSLGFVVDVIRMEHDHALIHEADYTIQQLFLDLTKVQAIDTTEFSVSIEDQAQVSAIVNAWVEQTQKVSPTAQKPLLSAGQITVPAVFDPSGSPLLPSHGAFSVTLEPAAPGGNGGPKAPQPGDLNYLLTMGGRGLPTDPQAGQFQTPWNPRPSDGSAPAHDGVLVISDFLLLEAVAVPILTKSVGLPADSFTLTRSSDGHGTVSLTKPHDMGNDVTMTGCTVVVDRGGTGNIIFTLDAQKIENLEDWSLVSVTVPQERTISLQLVTDAKDNLSLKLAGDTTTKGKATFSANTGVSKAADMLKYVVALPMLVLGPILAPIYAVVLAASEGIAQSIISATTDESDIAAALDKVESSMKNDLNTAIELPGSSVLSFSNLHFDGALAVFDADYIQMPALESPPTKPFMIPAFPRMGPDSDPTPDTTDPVPVGEAIVSYRLVDDPDYAGRQAQDNPYYILRREQYWQQLFRKDYPPHQEFTATTTWRAAMSKEDTTSMEQTASMRVTAGCRVAFDDYISAEVQTEIARELRMDRDTTTRTETEHTATETITYEATDAAYTVAMWTIVDRFTMCRADRYPIKTWEFVHADNYVAVDPPPPAGATTSTSGFDTTSFEKSLGDGNGAGDKTGAEAPVGASSTHSG